MVATPLTTTVANDGCPFDFGGDSQPDSTSTTSSAGSSHSSRRGVQSRFTRLPVDDDSDADVPPHQYEIAAAELTVDAPLDGSEPQTPAAGLIGFVGDESLRGTPTAFHHPLHVGTRASAPGSLSSTKVGLMSCACSGLSEIRPGLFVGSCRDLMEGVELHDIDAFVCVADEVTSPFAASRTVFNASCRKFPLKDGPSTSLATELPPILDHVDALLANGKRVAVFCQQGRSRSVACVTAWLMRRDGMTAAAALQAVQRVHPRADPNMSFVFQLNHVNFK